MAHFSWSNESLRAPDLLTQPATAASLLKQLFGTDTSHTRAHVTLNTNATDRNNLAVFSQLDNVGKGDIVEVYSGDKLYRYNVSSVRVVQPDAVKLLRSDSAATVTLITCTADLKHRLVVVGTLIA